MLTKYNDLSSISYVLLLSSCRPPIGWRRENESVQMTNLLWIELSIYLKASKLAGTSAKKIETSSGKRSVKHPLPIIAAETTRLSFFEPSV